MADKLNSMQLYNTLTQRLEALEFPDGVVRMYVCGITPYDTSHLGHARVGVVYDTLRRYLEHQGLHVRYVQNITDIDDPLFERAQRDGVDWNELGEQQTRRYLESLGRINVQKPETYVKASSAIPQMIPVIQRLLDLDHAYVRDGHVYYRAASFEDFGEIAHAPYAELLDLANNMGNNPDDLRKLDPLDFVLWQPSQPNEPAWDSPWGSGRPGWHIECSTLATEYLGSQIDIHGGGTDLIFPHHACEIAQAEPVTGVTPFVRCWMHSGMVELDGTKMSKSLGNMVFVDDVLATYSPDALRLAILSYPYRDAFEYSVETVERAEAWVRVIDQALRMPTMQGVPWELDETRFWNALATDFDTPAAIEALLQHAQQMSEQSGLGQDVGNAQRVLASYCRVLGLQIADIGKD